MKTVLHSTATRIMAKEWFIQLIMDIGPGFHPDTDASDYVDTKNGKPIFSRKQAENINKSLDNLFNILPDPYMIGLPVALSLLDMQ